MVPCCSTSRRTRRRPSAAFTTRSHSTGLHLLDAPVSGGPKGAETRALAIWVGGDEQIYQRHETLLRDIGDQPSYIGPIGVASVAKLGTQLRGLYDPGRAGRSVHDGSERRRRPARAVARRPPGIRRPRAGVRSRWRISSCPAVFDPPNFRLHLAHKDVSLATSLGRELNVPMRLANLALEELTEAVDRGWGERDSRVAMLLQEERGGRRYKGVEGADCRSASAGRLAAEGGIERHGQCGSRGWEDSARDEVRIAPRLLQRGHDGTAAVAAGDAAASTYRRSRSQRSPRRATLWHVDLVNRRAAPGPG